MLKNAALEFGRALADLASLEWACDNAKRIAPQVPIDGTGFLQTLALTVIDNVQRACILGDLGPAVGPELDRFREAVREPRVVIEDVRSRANHLRMRLYDDLKNEFYFQVAQSDVRYYGQKNLFGEEVTKRFPKGSADIESAGCCLALQQPIACVFHLMRAMEVAVRTLSGKLNVTITPQTTWRQMTGQMDGKIKAMPEQTEKQKRKKNDWEAARANLHAVGSVWRNNTMHPAATYTPSQAHDVFNAVRIFMSGLCAL